MAAHHATPHGPAFKFLRNSAGWSQAQVAEALKVTQPLVLYWEKEKSRPSPENWQKLEPVLTLGRRRGRERAKWCLAAWLGDRMQFLYDEDGALGVWEDRALAHMAAATLRVHSDGYMNVYAMPVWADYAADLAMERGQTWFAADEPSGADGVIEWFAVRARLLDFLASIMRGATRDAHELRQEVTA